MEVQNKALAAGVAASSSSSGFNSLGVPVNNLTMDEAIQEIFDLIEAFKIDKQAKMVATLNVDFMVNSLGYFFQTPRHPELLEILRKSSLVTADGFPVVWLSYFFGQPLKQRVTGADLVPSLSAACAQKGYSVYLFGGRQEAADKAAEKLLASSPDLTIAGIDCPMVHTEGEKALMHEEDDAEAIAKINASGADVLFIGLGNPKQEQWFHRNRHKLNVAVSIGIGGTFEFLAGTVKRAPRWIQKANLEWIYRIVQDPKRLWKRYVNGLIKFGLLSLPIVMYRLQELVFPAKTEDFELEWHTMWGSKNDVVRTLKLPKVVTCAMIQDLINSLEDQSASDSLYVIDLSRVKRIQLAAYHEIYRLGKLFQSGKVNGMLLGMHRRVQRRLEAARIRDAFSDSAMRSSLDMMTVSDSSKNNSGMQCRSFVLNDAALVYLSGIVSGESIRQLGLDIVISHTLHTKDCIIDLSQTKLLETTGAIAIASLFRSDQSEHKLFISGATHNSKQIFKLAKLDQHIRFMDEDSLHQRLFKA